MSVRTSDKLSLREEVCVALSFRIYVIWVILFVYTAVVKCDANLFTTQCVVI